MHKNRPDNPDLQLYGTVKPLTEEEKRARSEFEDGFFQVTDFLKGIVDGRRDEDVEEVRTLLDDMLAAAKDGVMTTEEVVTKLDALRQMAESKKFSRIVELIGRVIGEQYQPASSSSTVASKGGN